MKIRTLRFPILLLVTVILQIASLQAQENRLVLGTSIPAMVRSYDMNGQVADTLYAFDRAVYSLFAADPGGNKIYRTHVEEGTEYLQSVDLITKEVQLMDSNSHRVIDLFFDETNDRLIFLMDENNYVFSYLLTEDRIDTLYTTTTQPRAVAYIDSENVLLWSSNESSEIPFYAVDLDDQSSATLFTVASHVDNIVVVPSRNQFIFNTAHRILSSNYDGTNIDTLYSFGPQELPFDFVLDESTDQLYWTDYGVGAVRTGSIQGGTYSNVIENLRTPLSLAMASFPISTSTLQPEQKNIEVLIYPQPASDYVYLSFGDITSIPSVELIDVNGKLMTTIVKPDQNHRLDLSHLPSGTYFLRIETENGVITRKVSK